MRRLTLFFLLSLLALLAPNRAALADDPIEVVASFSILGDIAAQVGGERVAVSTLVGPDSDAHTYEPTPADARALTAADLVVVNGLGFEGWIERLVTASGYAGPVAVASDGIAARELDNDDDHGHAHGDAHGHDDIDPHAWQSLANGEIYARNIAAALTAVDAAGAAVYAANLEAYVRQIREVDAWAKAELAKVPDSRRRVITSHDAFGYFADAYGFEFLAPVGMSTEDQPSAGEVAALIDQINAEEIPAIFVENITDPRLIEQIARETGAAIGGTLYSDALSKPGEPAGTYLDMIRHNVMQLTGALLGS
jgi:zinc/manganese transport system substrate-binding protein